MTPEEAMNFLGEISNFVDDETQPIMFEGSEEMEEKMKYRIFKLGENAFNSQIGKYGKYYSPEYKEYWIPLRKQRGRQVDYVDLNFTGDLSQSITSIKDKNGATIQITDSENLAKANWQEYLQGVVKAGSPTPMDIFSSTKKEVKEVADDTEKKYLDGLDKIINSYQ